MYVAEHIRAAIGGTSLAIPDRLDIVQLTASLGVATTNHGDYGTMIDTDELMNAADRALYQA